MLRILIAITVAAAPLMAAGQDQKLEQSIQRVRARAAREAPPLAADTYLRTAELIRGTNPALGRECVMAALESLKQFKEASPSELRALRLLMSIDPAEGERVALARGNASGYIAVVDYWLGAGDLNRAGERLRQAWREGVWFPDAARMIGKVREKDAAEAAALYGELIDRLPAEQTTLHARLLADSSRDMAVQSPEAAKAGFVRLLTAVTSEKFNAAGSEEMIGNFKLGQKSIQAADTRETFLLPLGLYLRKIDPAVYEKNQALFAKWRDAIAAVKPEEVERAARPFGILYANREALPKLRAAGVGQPSSQAKEKLPFAEALASARSAPEMTRPFSYERLLDREDFTPEQHMQAAREMLALLPKVSIVDGPRLSLTANLFQTALDREWKDLMRPAGAALAATLTELSRCETSACAVQRTRRDTARAYSTLAAGVRQAHLRIKLDDESFAARMALLDLKDVLDEHHDFQVTSVNGEPFRLMAQRGRVVLLNFWATW